MFFHAAVMDIFRPFLRREAQLKTFPALDSSPDAVFTASLNQLKRLALIYRSNYSQASYALQWHHACLYIANAVLDEPTNPEWHSYFMLCIYGYLDLSISFRTASLVLKGLLAMAVEKGAMSIAEARDVLSLRGEHEDKMLEIRAPIVVDQTRALTDFNASQLEVLVNDFMAKASLDEFTHVADAETSSGDEIELP